MKKFVVAWALLICSASVLADPLADLKSFYAGVGSLDADFEQRLMDEDGDTLERYAGRFWMQKPGRFLWLYESPYALQLGADGQQLWHYDVDLKQITLREASSLSGTPAELLSGDMRQLEQYTQTRLPDADGMEWLNLAPQNADSDFSSIQIGMRDGKPGQIRLEDRLGQITLMEFHDLRANPKIAVDRFVLSVPAGVTVVDERPKS